MTLKNLVQTDANGVAYKTKAEVNPDGSLAPIGAIPGFSLPHFDYVGLTYDGSGNPTVAAYKTGGASGTLVATLTMAYDGSGNLTSVTRS